MIDDNADDLNDETAEASETSAPAEGAAPQGEAAPKDAAQPKGEAAPKGGDAQPKATLAAGADVEAEDKAKAEAKNGKAETQNWREEIARHYAAGNDKVYQKELKRLERITDVKAIWGMYRELDNRLNGGGLIKVPGKDAKPEEIAEYHKALGVPEKPEGYIEHIKLENGAVIGEADKPLLGTFSAAMHKAGAPPHIMNAAANWYYQQQEEAAAALDEADENFRRDSERALKDKYGPTFKRMTNSIPTVFATAPGGADAKNPNSLMSRLLGGRTADGRIIGNDPQVMDWLFGMAHEINPAVTVVEDGNQSGMSIDAEIEKIEKVMRTDRREYNEKHAGRYLELLQARDKIQSRQRA